MIPLKKLILLTTFMLMLCAESAHAKKILLFHVTLGMGTTTAAQGIADDLKARYPGVEVVLKDIREFSNPTWSDLSKKSYQLLTGVFPGLYDDLYLDYMAVGRSAKSIGDMPLLKQFRPQRVLSYIEEEKPDVILSTYHVATEVLIALRNQGKLKNIPIGGIHTDLVDETYFAKIALEIDMEFVATPEIRMSWLKRGVPEDRILATGMPLNPKVFAAVNLAAVSAFRSQKGLDSSKKMVLILGGSNGVGDYPLMVKGLDESFRGEPLQIVAVCGRNDLHVKNLTALQNKLAPGHELQITKLIPQNELFLYTQAADLIISKTGGLTPIELFYRKKPLILLDINGGQEGYNADFFAKAGLARVLKDQSKVGENAKSLLSSELETEAQTLRQAKFCEHHCSGQISDWAMSDPVVKPAIHHLIHLDTSPDLPPPSALVWRCARLLRGI